MNFEIRNSTARQGSWTTDGSTWRKGQFLLPLPASRQRRASAGRAKPSMNDPPRQCADSARMISDGGPRTQRRRRFAVMKTSPFRVHDDKRPIEHRGTTSARAGWRVRTGVFAATTALLAAGTLIGAVP